MINKYINRLLSSPTRRRIARGAIWGGVAAGGSRVVTIAASFFLARILGQVEFGEYGMVNSTAGMMGSLAGMGIGLTVTKHVAEFKNVDTMKVGRILALSSAVTMVSAIIYGTLFVGLSHWLAERTLSAPQLAPLLQISAITVVMGVINGVQTGSLSGVEAFEVDSYIKVATGIAQTIMTVLAAAIWGLKGAVAGMASGAIVMVIVTRIAVGYQWRKYNIRLRWLEAKREWRVLVKFSLPTFLTMLFIGPVYWACSVFLVNQPNGYAELGIFNAASQWQGAMSFIPGLVCTAMIPVMSEKYGTGDVSGSLHIMWRMTGLVACIAVPLVVVLSILSPWIIKGYGNSFVSGYWTMIFLLNTGAIGAIMTPVTQFTTAAGLMWQGFVLNLGWSLTLLLLSLFMARWGSEGLSFARLVAVVLYSISYFLFIRLSFKKGSIVNGP